MPRLTRNVPFIRPGTKKAPTATALPRLRAKTPSGRFLEFCRRFLVHVKGPKTGQPFVLAKWQIEQIVRPLVRHAAANGRRQYRVCYLTCPRKQGKSTLGAAIALFLIYCRRRGRRRDRERGEQRGPGGDHLRHREVDGGRRSPALRAMTMVYRRELRVPTLGARYKVIRAEAGTAHGLNLSGLRDRRVARLARSRPLRRPDDVDGRAGAAADVHRHDGGRREHSICAEVHRHAEQVRDGIVEDPRSAGDLRGARGCGLAGRGGVAGVQPGAGRLPLARGDARARRARRRTCRAASRASGGCT